MLNAFNANPPIITFVEHQGKHSRILLWRFSVNSTFRSHLSFRQRCPQQNVGDYFQHFERLSGVGWCSDGVSASVLAKFVTHHINF
jgi:hypothetical protein